RKRKCARCGQSATILFNFPGNSKRVHQHLWVKSLGLDEEVAKRELERFRTRVAAKEDIRWCDKHFGLDGLPLQAPLERRLGDGPGDGSIQKLRRVTGPEYAVVDRFEGGEGDGTVEGTNMHDDAVDMDMGGSDVHSQNENDPLLDENQPLFSAPLSLSQLQV
ncbi:hypothetical protein PMAYCL1PPCAC_02423, partial [Pristionchus mayeri]